MTDRTLVTAEELRELINRELDNHPDCGGLQVRPLRRLRLPDRDGCNWEVDMVGVGSSVPLVIDERTQAALARAANPVIAKFREKYNLT